MKKDLKVTRHEHKFYMSYTDYLNCKVVLSKLMKRDPYQKNDEGYFIRSLYFDTVEDTSVYEKLSGIDFRDKYRFRIYEFDQDWVKIERKRKVGMYISKTSVIVAKEDAEDVGNRKVESILNTPSVNSNILYYDFKRKYLRPVIIVDYLRDAYCLDYNNIRITFDKELRINDFNYGLFNPNLKTTKIQPDSVVVMEVKFDSFLPSWLRKMLSIRSLTSAAISKYTMGRMKQFGYDFTYTSHSM